MVTEYLTSRREGKIAVLGLDRPPANALNSALSKELGATVRSLVAEGEVSVVVIESLNDRFFMAGGDIKGYDQLTPDGLVETVRGYRTVFGELRRASLITIAAVDGLALGGGAELILNCDFRIVSPGARIGVPEIDLGGLPSASGTQMLTRAVGYSRALELMMSGRQVGGHEAFEIGLATHLDPESARSRAHALAIEIAERSPVALRWIKQCARQVVDQGMDAGFADEDLATKAVAETPFFWERTRAFAGRSAARKSKQS